MSRRRLPIVPHLTHDEIARRYRACRTGVEKTHRQVLWLLTRPDGPPAPAAVASLVGLSAGWVRAVLKRWDADGPDGLSDRRAAVNGGRNKLTADQQIDLRAAIQQGPPDGGVWTGLKVAGNIRDRRGVSICKQTGWEWLRGPGFSLRVPRPNNPGAAAPDEQRAWKSRHGPVGGRAAPPGAQ